MSKPSRALTLIGLLVPLAGCLGVRNPDDLAAFLDSRMSALGAVSFSAGIVRGDSLVWTTAGGEAQPGVAATPDTVYRVASVSKPVTGLAVMALVEQGRLDLDADISTYLPLAIRNPHHPEVPITARMLMSHTSSIADDWSYLDTLTSTPEPALPLEELVRNCLTPERRAEWKQSFLDARPGSVAAYSNTGVSLLAWVVESITGLPFEVFSARVVQGPLQVAHGAWFEQALPEGEVLARPYGFDRSAIEPFRVPTWPAGSYLSSARGFAPVASVFINRGSVGGAQIVRPSTLASMEELVRGPYGLCLEQLVAHTSEPGVRGHYGDIPGFHSGFLYQPTERVGAFYFAAGEFDHTLLRAEVESALLEAAREFEF